MQAFKQVVIVGAGVMGHSLAMLHASQASVVHLIDRDPFVLEQADLLLEAGLQTLKEAGALLEDSETIRKRIKLGNNLFSVLPEADLVVEAISEEPELKKAFFKQLLSPPLGEKPLASHTLVASNTSSLDIFSLAPNELLSQLYVAHHFVPAHIIPLVEVVQPVNPKPEQTKAFMEHYQAIGAIPILLKKFYPGFIINRLQAALHKELFQFLQDEVIDAQDLDLAVKASFGIRLPVLGLVKRLDFAGLKLALGNFTRLQPDATPPTCLLDLVSQGHLGVQTGKGFYDYAGLSLPEILHQRDEKLLAVRHMLENIHELP